MIPAICGVLGVLAMFRVRFAYVLFCVVGLAYFPAKVGFAVTPQSCEWLFGWDLALHSFRNYGHIMLFAMFYVMTRRQFTKPGWKTEVFSLLLCLTMGALVEAAQALSGVGHCRTRDLIPDTVGALIGMGGLGLAGKLRGTLMRKASTPA
ncbi:MAG: VanZ family protein [Betaproteobacteria bacterium]|nr:VanZ family protein [Betaproteobacteria bacterium]